MTESEVWELLGISFGASKKEIRKAYAAQLKNCHPEENQKEFEQLNKAYQYALAVAERQKETSGFLEKVPVFEQMGFENEEVLKQPETEFEKKIQQWEADYEQWFELLVQTAQEYAFVPAAVVSPVHMLADLTCVFENEKESKEVLTQVSQLFSNSMSRQFCFYEETKNYLLEQMKEDADSFLPKPLVQKFYEQYAKKVSESADKSEQKILHYLMKLLTFYRRLPEYNCRKPYFYKQPQEIGEETLAFWEYFFAYGYSCRQKQTEETTLTSYMEEIYRPSMEWRKEFSGFGKNPRQFSFLLLDGAEIKVEFHLYYVLYFYNNAMRIGTVPFSVLCREAEYGIGTIEFFCLLGMTDITEEETRQAKSLICRYLKKLPLYEPTKNVIADFLVKVCAPQEVPENEKKRVFLTLFGEDGRFCFRILASPRKFETHRYTKNGWVEMPLLDGEAKTYKSLPMEERPAFLQKKLEQLKQPAPRLYKKISLHGMSEMEKTRQITDALRISGKRRRKEKSGGKTAPYIPGSFENAVLSKPAYDFFAQTGGYMTNDYVLLHLGNADRSCFWCIFTVKMSIFGYDLEKKSPEASYWYYEREQTAEQLIEEPFYEAGRIGWGEQSAPYPIIIGDSGTFYSFDEKKGLLQADSFEQLLTELFLFEDVTEIAMYLGILTLSNFDRKLEYCYTWQDYMEYYDTRKRTLPWIFTDFWG